MITDFNNIFEEWNNNTNTNDIYHMILAWINTYENSIVDNDVVELISDIKYRMETNDETSHIVEDFIYGNVYEKIRVFMKK